MQFRHINDSAKKLTVQRLFSLREFFKQKRPNLGGPILEPSLHRRNSRKHFHRCAAFGAVDYDIGKKATFCVVSAIFHRLDEKYRFGTKVTVFGI